MVPNEQAIGRGVRAHNQAMIRVGGEQGCAASLDVFKPGITACGLSCGTLPRKEFYDK